MTAHVHDPATHGGGMRPEATPADAASTTPSRPRWLVPGLLVAIVVGGLVVADVLSLSTVLYAGLFGGMILMHVGGHGHGGHGGGGQAGRGHSLHGDGADAADDLSSRSSGAHRTEPGSTEGLDQRARANTTTSETDHHDQHSSHGCH
jgi:hypothetical protein